MPTFSEQSSSLLSEMTKAIIPTLLKDPFDSNINNHNCRVEVLNDDYSTVWVRWNKYDCEFKNLPITAAATIADTIIRN